MKTVLLTLLGMLVLLRVTGQKHHVDTSRAVVGLQSFRLAPKVVRAEFGKAIMLFNQTGYLGRTDQLVGRY